MLFPLPIPPGVARNGTEYQNAGRWYEAALMRWYAKGIRPFGGWVRKTSTNLGGPGRGMLTWRPSSFSRQAAIGTPDGLFIWDDDSIIDITPTGFPAGVPSTFYGVGYGFGPYGAGDYGVSSGSGATEATSWSMDTWGDYLDAVASHDRVIYEYDNDGNPAEPVANAPTALALFVTEERVLVALGADGNLRQIKWSDFENNTLWIPDFDNAAGDFRLQTDGTIVTGRAGVRGTNLIWTTTDLWRMSFIGGTLVYQFNQISKNCGLVAPKAIQVIEGGAVWMGQKNFLLFNGGEVAPIPCDLQDYVYGDINFAQAAKFHCGHIAAFGEVLFFYCSAGSTAIDRCVAYNYREGHWNIVDPNGIMARGCWADVGAFNYPLAVGEDGLLYQQETGFDADGVPILTSRYAKSGPVQLGSGDRLIEATQMLPDKTAVGDVQVRFRQRFTPLGAETLRGPYAIRSDGYTDIRVTARQVGLTIESLADADFRIGLQRLDGVEGGAR